ncbi:MAG: DNA sulfur modification protein DndB [Planctomycetota bacterium]|nr:MAG: DNA sulfur modification protein DndB [Planctomycetota bacterium]
MKLSFPAMRGRMGNRDYYVAMVKLSIVPKMFKFRDWAELPPEQRAQRVITKSRIPAITKYILENEDDYLFSSLTASYNCDPQFRPLAEAHPDIGVLEVPFDSDMIINDGQHRRAAIEEALREKPHLGEHTISVVLFPWEDLDRMQQMFSDLNRTARTTSKSLNILYNHRDLVSQITLTLSEKVEAFRGLVDKDRVSLPLRSPKLFTLGALHDATAALLGDVTDQSMGEQEELATDYWNAVAGNMPEWAKVKAGDMKPMELRQEFIHTHAVVLCGLGAMGKSLIENYPDDWAKKLKGLRNIDWRRTNKEWQGIAMSGTDVVNRRQSRVDTAAFIKGKLGLVLTPSEKRSLESATDVKSVMNDLRRFAAKA